VQIQGQLIASASLCALSVVIALSLPALALGDLPQDAGKRRRPFHQWLAGHLSELTDEGMASMTGDANSAGRVIASWILHEAGDDSERSGGLIGAPAVFYTPETSALFGFGGMYYLPTVGARGRVTQLTAAAAYTLKGQILFDFKPNVFWGYGRYHMYGEYRYSYFPDSFYGVGNSTQRADEERMVLSVLRGRSYLERRVAPSLYLGMSYEIEQYNVLEVTPGGILDTQPIQGREAATVSALGVMATYDSRDQTLTPTSGVFLYGSMALSTPELGGTERFGRFVVDARQFVSLWRGHVLAWQVVLKFIHGQPPFEAMSDMGGGRLGRGYFGGRFRDRHLLFGQVEYRAHVWWRVGVAAFGGAGQVAHALADMEAGQWRVFGGGGLRFLIDEDAGASLRFDVGFGADSLGVYFDAGEAF
jgi:hypothetical protein